MPTLTEHNRQAIARGSKSFAAAARLFPRALREDVHALYAWCRHCDDLIDGQALGRGQVRPSETPQQCLARLEQRTRAVFAGSSAGNSAGNSTGQAVGEVADDPPFQALARVRARHPLPESLALHHLEGFAMDVRGEAMESLDDVLRYSYHVAGCVGVMMAIIMGVRDDQALDRASDLGIAFQLTNIARDVLEDASVERCYLPADWLREAGVPASGILDPGYRIPLHAVTVRLVEAAEPYYASAAIGIRALPFRSAWAIATAAGVYRAIGLKVVRGGPGGMAQRAFTSTAAKFGHAGAGLGRALASRWPRQARAREGLWTRPVP